MTKPPSPRASNSADSISRADGSPDQSADRTLVKAPFSIAILPPVARFTVTHIADPGIDLFATAKRLQDPLVFLKGIELAAHWTDKGLPVFNNEFHTIAGREADVLTDFLRYGHLAFTTNGAGIFHPYSHSLQ